MLSDNIRNLRKLKGLSQEDLAIKLNVVRQTISKWEKGLSVPDSETLIRIAEELDTSVAVLLGEPTNVTESEFENIELKEIAAKLELLNDQFAKRSERQRKTWRTIFILLVIAAVFIFLQQLVGMVYYLSAMGAIHENISSFGGYDGPTNVYVSNISFKVPLFIATVTVAVLSIAGIYKTRRK